MGCAEWVKISILPTVQNIVFRNSNRIFVGTPLCAHIPSIRSQLIITSFRQESRLLSASHGVHGRCFEGCCNSYHVSKNSQAVRFSLRPCIPFISAKKIRIVVRMIANFPSKIRQMVEFIRPLVEERLKKMEEFGETWDDAPVRSSFFVWYSCYSSYGSTE